MKFFESPVWGPPVAYLYALTLDDPSLAWEYLRRNQQYRRDSFLAISDQEHDVPPSAWGLLHWEDPRVDSRSIEPAWRSMSNRVVVLVHGCAAKNAPLFDLWEIPGRKTLCHCGDSLNLTVRRGSEVLHRVRWSKNLTQRQPLSVELPAGRGFGVRARAAQRFLRSLGRNNHVGFPRRSERPSVSAVTHMQILQALDGEASGSSHREIALRLFGPSIDSSWDADSPWRARVRYLIECGRARTAHGYRRMLGIGDDEECRNPVASSEVGARSKRRGGLQSIHRRTATANLPIARALV